MHFATVRRRFCYHFLRRLLAVTKAYFTTNHFSSPAAPIVKPLFSPLHEENLSSASWRQSAAPPDPPLRPQPIQLLQASFFLLLAFTLALHAILSSTSDLVLHPNLRLVVFFVLQCTLLTLLTHLSTRPCPVLLLDYSCFLLDTDRKCSCEVSQWIARRSRRYTQKSEDFMHDILSKFGLDDETYVPASFFQTHYEPSLCSGFQEAKEGMTLAIDLIIIINLVIDLIIIIDLVIVINLDRHRQSRHVHPSPLPLLPPRPPFRPKHKRLQTRCATSSFLFILPIPTYPWIFIINSFYP